MAPDRSGRNNVRGNAINYGKVWAGNSIRLKAAGQKYSNSGVERGDRIERAMPGGRAASGYHLRYRRRPVSQWINSTTSAANLHCLALRNEGVGLHRRWAKLTS
jgi:hypothetical protein